MKYEERKQDLFEIDDSYYLAHCISADFAMGKGIAVEFAKRGIKNKLQVLYPNYVKRYDVFDRNGDCLVVDNVLNLVTKERYFEKPTYKSLENALDVMRIQCRWFEITKIAMPKIGCGLDGLDWNKVSDMIQDVFKDTDIEIVVCYLKD